jgi:hypothetical protein
MARGVFVNRASSHRPSVKVALARYCAEVTPTKRNTTQYREGLNHNPVTLVRKPSAPHRERRLAKTEAHRFPSDDERRRRRVSAPTKDLTSFKFFPEHSAQCGFVHWPRADGLAQRLID